MSDTKGIVTDAESKIICQRSAMNTIITRVCPMVPGQRAFPHAPTAQYQAYAMPIGPAGKKGEAFTFSSCLWPSDLANTRMPLQDQRIRVSLFGSGKKSSEEIHCHVNDLGGRYVPRARSRHGGEHRHARSAPLPGGDSHPARHAN